MKNNKFKLPVMALVAASAFCLSSCGDFLAIEPKTFVSEDNFWNEKTDIDQIVAGVYCKMQSESFIERCIMWGETRSDNIAEGLDASKQLSIYRVLKETLLPTNPYTDWAPFYAVINQCNTVIEMAPVVSDKDPVYTSSDVAATQAEMACLRDLCYFYLVRAFKDVPYYTNAVQSEAEVQNLPATNGDEIVRNLIADLEERVSSALKAYPKDKSRSYDPDCNRVTQNSIYALLTDLCLWDGQYQKAVNYAQKVIDSKLQKYDEDYASNVSTSSGALVKFQHPQDTYSKGFPLYPCFVGNQYGNCFDYIFCSKNSFESILELHFQADGSNDATAIANSAVAKLYGNHRAKDGNNGKGFLAVSEAVISDIAQKTWKVYETNQNDVRFYTDIYNPNAQSNEFTEGYSNKYVAYSSTVMNESGKYVASNSYRSYDNRNWVFYRLTDVMLMQAEALVELAGESTTYDEEQADGTTVKKYDDNLARAFYLTWAVNRRSMMTNNMSTYANELKINKYNTKSEMRDLVLAERRRELMFEGKRWFDLLRQCHREGNTDYIKSHVGPKGGASSSSNSLFANNEALYWPYNKREVINNPNLDQKPYYGGSDDDKGYESTVK